MAWPPPVQPINTTNATVQQDVHPQLHNAANQAINDTVATLQSTINETARLRALNQAAALNPVHVSGNPGYIDTLIGSMTLAAIASPNLIIINVRCAYTLANTGAGNMGVSVHMNGTPIGGAWAPYVAGPNSINFGAMWNLALNTVGLIEVFLTTPPTADVTTTSDWLTHIVEAARFAT